MAIRNFELDKWYLLKSAVDPFEWHHVWGGWSHEKNEKWVGTPGKCVDSGINGELQAVTGEREFLSPTWDVKEVPVYEAKCATGATIPLIEGLKYTVVGETVATVTGKLTGLAKSNNPKDPIMCQLVLTSSGIDGWWPVTKLQPAWEPIRAPVAVCKCPMSVGCSCGVFAAEQAALGRVYDPILRFWRKP